MIGHWAMWIAYALLIKQALADVDVAAAWAANRRECAERLPSTDRLYLGASCFFRVNIVSNWRDAWARCNGTISGARPAHVYDAALWDALYTGGLLDVGVWYRFGLTAKAGDSSLLVNNGVWRNDPIDVTGDDEDVEADTFLPGLGHVALTALGFTGLMRKLASGARSVGAAHEPYSVFVLCEKRAPGERYTLTHKNMAPVAAPLLSLPSLSADVRRCASQCASNKRCWRLAHSATAGDCRLYARNAIVADAVMEGGVNMYDKRSVNPMHAACARWAMEHGAPAHVYAGGKCTAMLPDVGDFEQALARCKYTKGPKGVMGRLAYLRNKAEVRAFKRMQGATGKCAYVNVRRRDPTTTPTVPYSDWVYIDGEGRPQPAHPLPHSWALAQPIAGPYHYVIACAPQGLRNVMTTCCLRNHALCEYDDADYHVDWRTVADGAGRRYNDDHILAEHDVQSYEHCGALCRRRPDCASFAYSPAAQSCLLQRYEIGVDNDRANIPVNVTLVPAAGYQWYEDSYTGSWA